MDEIGRNDPCWCGSGSKYKRCHLNRENEPRPAYTETLATERRTKQSVCMHPQAPNDCEGGIVQAHTVQKAGGLRRIARDGHVYAAKADLAAITKAGGKVPFQLIGINRASTFTGFCGKHDTSCFAPSRRNRSQ